MRIVSALLLSLACAGAGVAGELSRTVQAPPFGAVTLIRHADEPKGLVILLADDAAPGPHGLAAALAGLDYAVIRLRPAQVFAFAGNRQGCLDVAAAILTLAAQTAKSLGGAADEPPIVVGAGDGAVLAYLAAVQARPSQLHAAVSIAFQAKLPAGVTPCTGEGQATPASPATLEPGSALRTPWFVFQPQSASTRGSDAAAEFISRVPDAQLTGIKGPVTPPYRDDALPEFMALMQWLDPRIAHQVTSAGTLAGLPLTEVPAEKSGDDRLVVMLSGDGGWAALDRGVSAEFAARGIGTVGLDSLHYFWTRRTPDETAEAVAGIIEKYTKFWNRPRVILFGYSFGADVLPFVVNRLPPSLQARVERVVFAGLGPQAAFEFHLSNWLSDAPQEGPPVIDEIRRMPAIPAVCIYGADEGPDSACPALKGTAVVLRELPGDHHFDEDYARVAQVALGAKAAP
jgi:type IV secretory pathway VirJ component